jgi:N-acetylglucosamine-6-phosphate deacetylase
MRLRARHYATGQLIEVACNGGRIVSVGPPGSAPPDAEADWIAPALFDLQVNGCDGHNFTSERLTPEAVRHVTDACRRHGIGQYLPTVTTNSFAAVAHGLATIRRACEEDRTVAAAVAGVHLEGPYISAEDGPRGAHPRQHVRPPDWEGFRRLQDAAGGMIRLVTLAPELDGALAFIARLTAAGVLVALGHTAATGPRIREAAAAGARLSTHLGNGCHAALPRHDNYVWEQLAADELWASIITDGHHLPPAVVRCIVRVKTPSRLVLTCDASPLAGLPPGRYREWDQDVEVLPTGRVVVSGTSYLAGSGVFTDACLGPVMRFAGVSLADAVDMAGAQPRRLLGLPPRRLEPGAPAELVLFDYRDHGEAQVRRTVTSPG